MISLRSTVLTAALFSLLALPVPAGPEALPAPDIDVSLEMVSPNPLAGEDVRLKLTLTSPSGKGLSAAMFDASCFHLDLGGGKVIVPPKEGLKKSPIDLGGKFGGAVTVSRTINMGTSLKISGCCVVKAWWEYRTYASDKISFGVFEWPLDRVEAVIETDHGTMTVAFLPDKAPATAANFVKLSKEGFYDGLIFHRIISGFMIQGGCPDGDGMGGPGYMIKAEFNDTLHEKGVLSMARSRNVDSAGSQFFIMHGRSPSLDGKYTAFGKLVSGFDVLDKIASVRCRANPSNPSEKSSPIEPPKILKITVRVKDKK
jgi:peptidyl-prolyl cis-trans isomerase B (cyclophilin B)